MSFVWLQMNSSAQRFLVGQARVAPRVCRHGADHCGRCVGSVAMSALGCGGRHRAGRNVETTRCTGI